MLEIIKDLYKEISIIDLFYLALTILSLINCYKKGFILSILSMTTIKSQSFYDLSIKSIDNTTIKMSEFKGKYVMIVNVASYCGYTSQYADLQKLSQKYTNQLAILAVPCNQFGAQEPGSEQEIKTFCKNKFNVTSCYT